VEFKKKTNFQKYTQSGGARPFGISILIAGFDPDNTPHLYVTDPTGTSTEWQVWYHLFFIFLRVVSNDMQIYKATAIGRSSDIVREYLEKHFQRDLDLNGSS